MSILPSILYGGFSALRAHVPTLAFRHWLGCLTRCLIFASVGEEECFPLTRDRNPAFTRRILASRRFLGGIPIPATFHEAWNIQDLSRAGRIRHRPGLIAHPGTIAPRNK